MVTSYRVFTFYCFYNTTLFPCPVMISYAGILFVYHTYTNLNSTVHLRHHSWIVQIIWHCLTLYVHHYKNIISLGNFLNVTIQYPLQVDIYYVRFSRKPSSTCQSRRWLLLHRWEADIYNSNSSSSTTYDLVAPRPSGQLM